MTAKQTKQLKQPKLQLKSREQWDIAPTVELRKKQQAKLEKEREKLEKKMQKQLLGGGGRTAS